MLVRATASLRLFEEALEEQGLPTYVVGGRGYWSQEQVRDGLAYLRALANPRDEEALLGVLASPFCGVGIDALILLAAGRGRAAALGGAALRGGAGSQRCPPTSASGSPRSPRFFAAERAHAERLAGRGAARARDRRDRLRPRRARPRRRRAAAREPAQADAAGARVRARRGARPARLPRLRRRRATSPRRARARRALESEGLDAVRLMTIHRAKGLEFPVVCVADLGRQGGGRTRARCCSARDGAVGLRLAPLGGGDTVPALAYERLAGRGGRARTPRRSGGCSTSR